MSSITATDGRLITDPDMQQTNPSFNVGPDYEDLHACYRAMLTIQETADLLRKHDESDLVRQVALDLVAQAYAIWDQDIHADIMPLITSGHGYPPLTVVYKLRSAPTYGPDQVCHENLTTGMRKMLEDTKGIDLFELRILLSTMTDHVSAWIAGLDAVDRFDDLEITALSHPAQTAPSSRAIN